MRSSSSDAHIKNGEADGGEHEDHRSPGGNTSEHVGRGARAESGLRTLSAKGAGQIGRFALLQQHHENQNKAHQDVQDDDETEKEIHVESCFPSQSGWPGRENFGAEEGT